MDQRGDILLVGQAGLQGVHIALQPGIRLCNGLQRYRHIVVLQILEHEHGVVPLLLGLDLVPVGKAGEALLHIEI